MSGGEFDTPLAIWDAFGAAFRGDQALVESTIAMIPQSQLRSALTQSVEVLADVLRTRTVGLTPAELERVEQMLNDIGRQAATRSRG